MMQIRLSRHDGGLQLEEHCFCRYHPQLRNGYLSSFNVMLYPYKIITCYLVTLSYLVILLSGKTVTLIPYYLSYSVTLLHCYFVTLLPQRNVTLRLPNCLVTLYCHPVTLLLWYLAVPCYPFSLFPCHLGPSRLCYFVSLSPCSFDAFQLCYFVILLPCYFVALLFCCLVRRDKGGKRWQGR